MNISPQDIDAETGLPYSGYSSPSLDTSFHDHEMDVDDAGLVDELAVAAKHIAVKLSETYKAAGIDPRKCQAIQNLMSVIGRMAK